MVLQQVADRLGANLNRHFLAVEIGQRLDRAVAIFAHRDQAASKIRVGEIHHFFSLVGDVDGRDGHFKALGDEAGNQAPKINIHPVHALAHCLGHRFNKLDIEPGALVVLNKFHRRKCGIGADAQDVVLSVNIDTCECKCH